MTDKMKVKDLAAELGLSNKDILQRARDAGIHVRSFMGTLEPEEVDRLREASPAQTESSATVVREVQPGVIVRRRKATPPTAEEAKPKARKEAPKKPVEQPAEEQPAPKAAETKDDAPKAKTTAKDVAEKPAPAARKAEEPKARIISVPKAQEPEPAPEPKAETVEVPPAALAAEAPTTAKAEAETSAAPVVPTVEETTPKPAVKVEAQEAAAAETPTAEAPVQEAAEATEGEEKKKKKPRREVHIPQVRIISRPDPNQPQPQPAAQPRSERPYEPRRPAGPGGPRPGGPGGPRPAGPGGPRPSGPRPGGPGGPRPGGPDAAVPPRSDKDGEAGKRGKQRKKDRRVVEFSHGAPGFESEEAARRAAAAGGPGKRKPMPGEEEGFRRHGRRKRKAPKEMPQEAAQPQKAVKRKIRVDETIRVSDLAKQMAVKAPALIKALFALGVMATINQALDLDTATLLASEFGYEVENVSFDEQEFLVEETPDTDEDLKPRPPVVTIMGHVDHGKTSLLDAIRTTNVTAGEAGGITQHIGAYHVATDRGEVVFLDTPGHEAFTTMRARGAQVTDIVVLVVAADDGVMDQTREAINHARAANVPIVVAVNKIDKEGANPDRVRRELSEFGLVPEDWGGETIYAHVSAKQKVGIDSLLEMILLQAEVLELKANPDKHARGHIIEAKLDKGRGPVGTLLIREGSIKMGDSFVCGVQHGKVRALFNDQGKKIKSAGPAWPVEIQGFDGVPEAGDEFAVVADDKVARRIAQSRMIKQREKELGGKSKISLESFLASKPDQEAKSLNLLVKADVQGSLEAIGEALNKLSTDEVKVQVVHGGAGAITESDVMLAAASQAIIIGFNVRPTAKVKEMAERENIEIRFYDIIYKLVGEIKDAMSGMLTPDIQEAYLGQAEVRNTFSVPKVGTVAGCGVVDGKLTRNAKVRLLRDGVVVYTGQLASLKRFKDDAKEVLKGYECGVGLENFNDVKIGDVIEAFELKEVARTLE
ncbi:translation initiation factor IF-2 [Desulfovibrio aminophilus]|uniref:translation initiation factor IF-2 n=1 Tax=Desulfovibrio aminophilus TaxID=81425 RepID=UPI00040D0E38|nr:translation initiation factor IF-2 [Desulfovibrio aminophilus]